MAYENRNAAYDLSLFDEDISSSAVAVPKHREQEEAKPVKKVHTGNKIVKLPEEEINRIRRRKHNPLKLAAGTIGGAVVALVISAIIVGQVQITELNQQIISAQETLENSQSVYTQTELKLAADLTTTEIEDYAENVLGMTKASNIQKEFVTLEGGDKAEVSAQADENLFTRFIDSLKNLWS